MVAYKALDIARYVIDYSNYKKHRIINLRLKKILYFIQADFLIFKQRSYFDDKIEAWGRVGSCRTKCLCLTTKIWGKGYA